MMKQLSILAIAIAVTSLGGCSYWKYFTTERTPEDDGFTSSRSIFAKEADTTKTTAHKTTELEGDLP